MASKKKPEAKNTAETTAATPAAAPVSKKLVICKKARPECLKPPFIIKGDGTKEEINPQFKDPCRHAIPHEEHVECVGQACHRWGNDSHGLMVGVVYTGGHKPVSSSRRAK